MFENPRRGRLARNFAKTVQKILDLKSSSEQIFSENCRWVPLSITSQSSLQEKYAYLADVLSFVQKAGAKIIGINEAFSQY